MPALADEAENIQIATSMVDAINDRDLARLDQLIAPEFVRHSAATAGVSVTNLEEFKAFLKTDFAAVPDSAMAIDVIFGNDEFVSMRAIYSGTQTGKMGPFAASGKKVDLPFIGILRFTNGKISEMWVEWDNIFMLTQLGHFPPLSEESE
jgi:predicted ester cyclase